MLSACNSCNDWVSGPELFSKPSLAPAREDREGEAGRMSRAKGEGGALVCYLDTYLSPE